MEKEVKHEKKDVEHKIHEEKNHEHLKDKHHKHHDEHCKCHEHHDKDCKCHEHHDKDCKCHDKHEHHDKDCKCHDKHEHHEPPHEKRIKELEDELLRSKAEFINYRKRLEEEQSRLLKFCNEDLIKETLPILDNFERAISMDDTNLEDEVSKFLSGFKMIYCNFVNILKNYGVVEIDGNNKPFDPVYHEAIMTEKREGVEPGMVLDVLQKGYILKGKVIRPAMVKVSE